MPTSVELHVAFWNAWLLSPRLGPRGPRVPDLNRWFGPDVDARAPLVGEALAGRFDVAALSECFERSEQEAVAAAWPGSTLVTGPGRRALRLQGSGLATLLGPGMTLERCAELRYRAGGDLRDSDTFATKGALLTSIRVGDDGPLVEVVSTHLFAGGDFLPIPGSADADRHHLVRMEQVDELVGFIAAEHDPEAVLLVVGDFNIAAHTNGRPDPLAEYQDLAAHMDRAGLRDLWAEHGVGPGHTCTFTDAAQLPPDPDEPDQVADDPDALPGASPGERIDYLWLAAPEGVEVDVDRPRRWAFSGREATGGPAGSLSDHLAVSARLRITTA